VQAGFAYSRKRFVAEVAVRQANDAGGASLRAGPLLDAITVGWGEVDAADGAVARKRRFKLRDASQVLEIDVESRRRRGTRPKRARLSSSSSRWAARPDAADEEEEAEEGEGGAPGGDVPLLWLRLDPDYEWAVNIVWPARGDARWGGTPEFMAREQLELARDVGAQCEAARSLASFEGSATAVAALSDRLGDAKTFHRVRAAVAESLRQLATNDTAPLDALIGYIRRFHCDGAGLLLPYRFVSDTPSSADGESPSDDLGHYLTLRAVVNAIGCCRDARGQTPADAILLLHEILDESTNAANPCDDGFLLGSAVELLGGANPAAEAGDDVARARVVASHVASTLAQVRSPPPPGISSVL